MNTLNQSIWPLYRQLTLIYAFSKFHVIMKIISCDTLKWQNIMQFQTILGKFCIEYALNFEIWKKDNKIVYFRFSNCCDFIAVLRGFSVALGKWSIFVFNRVSLYLVIKGNEYKMWGPLCTKVWAEDSWLETLMNNFYTPIGIWCSSFKWNFICLVL